MPTENSFPQGSTFPSLQPDTLRLYSMRFCPFAQRTRLLLEHKHIPYETVNVHLRHKPDWFLERNPLGLVPVLEHDGKIVFESVVCNEYIETIYPQNRCSPEDAYQLARDRMVVECFNKTIPSFYKLLRHGEQEDAFENIQKRLEMFENELMTRGSFFAGDNVGNLDFLLWPWFERLTAVDTIWGLRLSQTRFPNITRWITRMYEIPAVKETMFDASGHVAFVTSFYQKRPDYDYGLDGSVTSKL